MTRMSTPPISFKPPRSKLIAALLALGLGAVGAHAWYLRRSHAWLITLYAVVCGGLAASEPVWWDNPAFFLLFIPAIDGFVEAAVFSLLADEKFDARYNAGRPANRTGCPRAVPARVPRPASTTVGSTRGMPLRRPSSPRP